MSMLTIMRKLEIYFLSFSTVIVGGKKTTAVGNHKIVEVNPQTVKLDNGVSISRINGRVLGVTCRPRRVQFGLPRFFPATTENKKRALRFSES